MPLGMVRRKPGIMTVYNLPMDSTGSTTEVLAGSIERVTFHKRLVVLVGMPKAVAIAVKRADAVKRYSALRSRLHEGL